MKIIRALLIAAGFVGAAISVILLIGTVHWFSKLVGSREDRNATLDRVEQGRAAYFRAAAQKRELYSQFRLGATIGCLMYEANPGLSFDEKDRMIAEVFAIYGESPVYDERVTPRVLHAINWPSEAAPRTPGAAVTGRLDPSLGRWYMLNPNTGEMTEIELKPIENAVIENNTIEIRNYTGAVEDAIVIGKKPL